MNIYEQTLKTWGLDSQLGMVQEECAELIKVINKYHRHAASISQLIEECVDVELMIEQMRVAFCDEQNTWDRIRIEKLERLANLLKQLESDIER